MNSCRSCKQGKRRCDRGRPSCSTCARFGRSCVYPADDSPSPIAYSPIPGNRGGSPQPSNALQQPPLVPALVSGATGTDSSQYAHHGKQAVNIQVGTEVLKVFGTFNAIRGVADTYFDSVALRLPIVSKKRFYDRLAMDLTLGTPADFALLCLCMHLSQQPLGSQLESMQSSFYVNVKNMISLLEATSFQSLEFIQCRVITSFYELGHGIYPAASISIGACARLARGIRLHKDRNELPEGGPARLNAEEKRRVWWAIVNIDRFVNLCGGDGLFASDDPKVTDLLPIGDGLWSQGVGFPQDYAYLNLSAPADITVGQFARECQVSHLTGRVLKHVFDPLTSDPAFNDQAASQLERTLMAFMPLLIEEETRFGKYCAALGICTCALYTLYDSAVNLQATDDAMKSQILSSMEPLSKQIAEFSRRLFGNGEGIDYGSLSPYVPYSLYQSAVVQYQLWKQTGQAVHKAALDSLKEILGHFSKRWLIAGRYLEALAADAPTLMLPWQDL